MSRGQPRDARKEQFGRSHLTGWQRSGLSVRAYCADHDLAEPSFYAWRRTLAQRDASTQPATPVTFVPLHILPPPPPAAPLLEVVLRNGRLLRLTRDVPAAILRDLVAALEDQLC